MYVENGEIVECYIIQMAEIPNEETKTKSEKWIESRTDKELKVYYIEQM